jgi:hypothetical protein
MKFSDCYTTESILLKSSSISANANSALSPSTATISTSSGNTLSGGKGGLTAAVQGAPSSAAVTVKGLFRKNSKGATDLLKRKPSSASSSSSNPRDASNAHGNNGEENSLGGAVMKIFRVKSFRSSSSHEGELKSAVSKHSLVTNDDDNSEDNGDNDEKGKKWPSIKGKIMAVGKFSASKRKSLISLNGDSYSDQINSSASNAGSTHDLTNSDKQNVSRSSNHSLADSVLSTTTTSGEKKKGTIFGNLVRSFSRSGSSPAEKDKKNVAVFSNRPETVPTTTVLTESKTTVDSVTQNIQAVNIQPTPPLSNTSQSSAQPPSHASNGAGLARRSGMRLKSSKQSTETPTSANETPLIDVEYTIKPVPPPTPQDISISTTGNTTAPPSQKTSASAARIAAIRAKRVSSANAPVSSNGKKELAESQVQEQVQIVQEVTVNK